MPVHGFWQSGDTATVVYCSSFIDAGPASSLPQAGRNRRMFCSAALQLIHGCCLEWLWSSSKDRLPRACSFVASSTIAWIDERAVFQRASRLRLSVRQATHSARRAIASAIFLLCPGWKSALEQKELIVRSPFGPVQHVPQNLLGSTGRASICYSSPAATDACSGKRLSDTLRIN